MKISIISPAYPPSVAGEAEHCFEIARRFQHAGHHVAVITTRKDTLRPPRAFAVFADMKGWRWRDLPRLLWRQWSLRSDAVLIIYTPWLFDQHPLITYFPWLVRLWQPKMNVLVLAEIYQPPNYKPLSMRLGKKLLTFMAGSQNCDYSFGNLLDRRNHVAVLGPSILEAMCQHRPDLRQRALVVPPPPLLTMVAGRPAGDRDACREKIGLQPGETLLAYFGYVYEGKGIETLFAALKLLVDKGCPCRLVMAGGGRSARNVSPHALYESRMLSLAHSLGVAQAILWPEGYDSGDDEADLHLRAADIGVLPFDDGAELRRSSIAVVSAMGLPLITTAPQHREEAFVHGVNAMLCPPHDPTALALAIEQVMQDAPLQARLRLGAAQLAADWFSWDATIDKLLAAIRRPVA